MVDLTVLDFFLGLLSRGGMGTHGGNVGGIMCIQALW